MKMQYGQELMISWILLVMYVTYEHSEDVALEGIYNIKIRKVGNKNLSLLCSNSY